MKKVLLLVWALGSLIPAVAENISELTDSSRVRSRSRISVKRVL